MAVSSAIVEQIRRELRDAPHGHKSVIARRWAEVLGVSLQQVYRIAADGPKKARSSSARRPEYREWAKAVAMVKKRPPDGAGEISTDQAVEIAAKRGLVPEEALSVAIGTFDRIMRETGVTRRKRRFTRYQAERPNLAHHIDASSSKFFYVHRRVGNEYVLRIHRPGANGYKNKPIPCDRLRPWIYGLVDDHSGRMIARYTIAAGESMADALLFLQRAWSEIGLPEQLLADQGVLKKGLPSQDLIRRLDVSLPEMMPYEKEAHGKIERPWRTAWQRFEKPFFAVDDWQKYEITEAELNRRLDAYLEEYNSMSHRFEREITRMQAWGRIRLHGGIVTIPENALATAARRAKRKVGADGILQYEGGIYEVKGLHEADVWVFEGVFEDRLVVQEISTGDKYEVMRFAPVPLGEYRAHPETPHQQAVREASSLNISDAALPYTETREKDERIVEMPIRETERAIEDPFDTTTYASMEEAFRELISIVGTAISAIERRGIEELIAENGMKKEFVRDLALELRAEIEIRRASAG
ncbi:MAG: hypothetical protein HS130_07750 [Deltaproteobacteria bacterium]|nr:hypothetical protein [Deltaproteobacteria bacterium]MCL4873095.1 hypothetical protein [bacterium]